MICFVAIHPLVRGSLNATEFLESKSSTWWILRALHCTRPTQYQNEESPSLDSCSVRMLDRLDLHRACAPRQATHCFPGDVTQTEATKRGTTSKLKKILWMSRCVFGYPQSIHAVTGARCTSRRGGRISVLKVRQGSETQPLLAARSEMRSKFNRTLGLLRDSVPTSCTFTAVAEKPPGSGLARVFWNPGRNLALGISESRGHILTLSHRTRCTYSFFCDRRVSSRICIVSLPMLRRVFFFQRGGLIPQPYTKAEKHCTNDSLRACSFSFVFRRTVAGCLYPMRSVHPSPSMSAPDGRVRHYPPGRRAF
jgi:hypothetical protein